MALSSVSINLQLGHLVQTSQNSRGDSTIHNKAIKITKHPSESNKAGNLAQKDLNYSGEPPIQNIHFGYTYIPDTGIRKKKLLFRESLNREISSHFP